MYLGLKSVSKSKMTHRFTCMYGFTLFYIMPIIRSDIQHSLIFFFVFFCFIRVQMKLEWRSLEFIPPSMLNSPLMCSLLNTSYLNTSNYIKSCNRNLSLKLVKSSMLTIRAKE